MYWECTHGCKVFFEFDKFGRFGGKHKCKGRGATSRPKKKRPYFDYDNDFDISTVSKSFIEKLFKESYKCPVCKEEFASESHYYQHLNGKKNYDDDHNKFYNQNKNTIEYLTDEETRPINLESCENTSLGPEKVSKFPRDSNAINEFGRIKLKDKNGKVKAVHHHKDWWDVKDQE
ncbi:MAG: hypothetical protein ACFFCS_22140 [Candidatus Hodarchaeota archaeon]